MSRFHRRYISRIIFRNFAQHGEPSSDDTGRGKKHQNRRDRQETERPEMLPFVKLRPDVSLIEQSLAKAFGKLDVCRKLPAYCEPRTHGEKAR